MKRPAWISFYMKRTTSVKECFCVTPIQREFYI
jgi:hypothetical protein